MPISYRKLFELLEEKGWTTYRIRKEKLIGQGTLTALKKGTGGLDSKTIARICDVLDCQPGDLMEYVPDWVENRILELTEQREQELIEYYEHQWSLDDSLEEEIGLKYQEEIIMTEIEKLESCEDTDQSYADALLEINQHYNLRHLNNSWDEIEKQYEEYFHDIKDFFTPFISAFNNDMQEEHNDYIKQSVKRDLEEEKSDIEKQALEEYLSE